MLSEVSVALAFLFVIVLQLLLLLRTFTFLFGLLGDLRMMVTALRFRFLRYCRSSTRILIGAVLPTSGITSADTSILFVL